jgi:hypothetical protein
MDTKTQTTVTAAPVDEKTPLNDQSKTQADVKTAAGVVDRSSKGADTPLSPTFSTETEWKITIQNNDGSTNEIMLSPTSVTAPNHQEVRIVMPGAKEKDVDDMEAGKGLSAEEVSCTKHRASKITIMTNVNHKTDCQKGTQNADLHHHSTVPHRIIFHRHNHSHGSHAHHILQLQKLYWSLALKPSSRAYHSAAHYGHAELHSRSHNIVHACLQWKMGHHDDKDGCAYTGHCGIPPSDCNSSWRWILAERKVIGFGSLGVFLQCSDGAQHDSQQ